jgi:hypothetical protein
MFVASMVPSPARAESSGLRWPTIAAGAAATADWVTTYHALKFYNTRELNPVLKPFQANPGGLVALGGVIDIVGVTGWNLTVGKKHPKLAALGLWSMAGFRSYLAVHNHLNERRAGRR